MHHKYPYVHQQLIHQTTSLRVTTTYPPTIFLLTQLPIHHEHPCVHQQLIHQTTSLRVTTTYPPTIFLLAPTAYAPQISLRASAAYPPNNILACNNNLSTNKILACINNLSSNNQNKYPCVYQHPYPPPTSLRALSSNKILACCWWVENTGIIRQLHCGFTKDAPLFPTGKPSPALTKKEISSISLTPGKNGFIGHDRRALSKRSG
ncbi:hypothetical protein CEXT_16771 [Caerostris extrusa]|uniref:Uncharacterized protein n=1 Tax=Caerostris extrusa TaxID=172846 RepID=A0AAV4S6M5_CAEEX|nr:hypothetical protein CEXT_16771 [Caerostris extrusa]